MSDDLHVIRTAGELRAALGGPSTSSGPNTIRPRLADTDRAFIAASPLWLLSTVHEDAGDVSPRGDEPGSVLVLDDSTLALPERTGNRRGDGYHNLLVDDRVGLIFIVPGRNDELRVGGRATMVTDAPWFDRLTLDGVRPPLALLVDVNRVFYHCVKAFRRARLWEPEMWVDAAPSQRQIAAAVRCELAGEPV